FFLCRRGTPSFANGLRLFLVVPPQRLYGEAVVGLRLLEAELVPIGNAMIRCIPIWNPVETCTQDPIQRFHRYHEIVTVGGGCGGFDQLVYRRVGHADEIVAALDVYGAGMEELQQRVARGRGAEGKGD